MKMQGYFDYSAETWWAPKYPLFFSAYIQGWGYFKLHYYQLTVNFHQIGDLQNDLLASIVVLMVKFLYV